MVNRCNNVAIYRGDNLKFETRFSNKYYNSRLVRVQFPRVNS